MLASELHSISTEEIETSQRSAFWREQICDVFVELDCTPLDHGLFGRINSAGMGALQLSQVISSPQAVRRSKRQLARAIEDCMLVSLQVSGTCEVKQDGRRARLNPGDMAMYDSTRCYDLVFGRQFEQLVMKIPRSRIVDCLGTPEQITAVRVPGDNGIGRIAGSFVNGVVDQLEHVEDHQLERLANNTIDIVGSAFAGLFTDTIVPTSTAKSALLMRVKSFVCENLRDPDLSREHIAAANGISIRYLTRIFEGEDTSLMHWVREQRLANIAVELTSPEFQGRTIAEIAYAWGMKCLPNFNRAFKNHFGTSPKQYRQEARAAKWTKPHTKPSLHFV